MTKCYHEGNIVFGPAVIAAYNIEKNTSRYPRIVISESVISDGLNALAPINDIFKKFTKRDKDSHWFVNCLRLIRLFCDSMETKLPEDFMEMINGIKEKIDKELKMASEKETKPPSINDTLSEVDKISWVKEYFEWATDRSHIELLHMSYPS